MDKLKNLLHKDSDSKQDTAGATGKLTGEGSHFGADSSKAGYGAQPGVGISSFTEAQGNAGTTPIAAAHDSTVPSTSATGTAAPQIKQSDFGESLTNPTATSGSTTGLEPSQSFPSKATDDVASVGSVKSGVQGIGGTNSHILTQDRPLETTTGSSTGLTGTSLANRSVPPGNSAAVEQPYTERAFALTGGDSSVPPPVTTQNWPDAGASGPATTTGTVGTTHTQTAPGVIGATGVAGATSSLDQGAISSTTGISGHHPTFTGERLDTEHASHQKIQSFNEPGVGTVGTTTTDPTNTGTTQGHTDRDASLVGAAGLGAAGTATAFDHSGDKSIPTNTSTAPASTTIGSHSGNTANVIDPNVGSDLNKAKDYSTVGSHPSDLKATEGSGAHHTARNTALAGGATGVGAAAYEHEKHDKHDTHDKHEHDEKSKSSGGGLLGFPKHKDKDETSAKTASDDEPKTHHTTRDTALAGGAVGAGTAAYEHEKHEKHDKHEKHEHDDKTKSSGGFLGLGKHKDKDETSAKAAAIDEPKTHHTTRDTALAGGAAGVGAAAYEHEKHEKHEPGEKDKSSGGFLGLGKHKDHDTTDATKTDKAHPHRDSRLGSLGLLHKDNEHFQHDGDNEHTAKEKYFGGSSTAAQDSSASGVPETHPHHKERDLAAAGGAGAVGAAAIHEHDKDTEESGEKKQGFFSKLLHRDNPNKLQKDPPEGYAAATAPAPVAAHETFVKPGVNHEQHIGVDGPIGRGDEVSGFGGSDARHTTKADELPSNVELMPAPVTGTLHEKADHAAPGVVIEARTGLPMNVGKYGSGAGGTDGAQQVAGYDERVNEERLQEKDAHIQQGNEAGVTWDKIKGNESASGI